MHVGFIAAAIWIMPTLFDLADSIFTDDTLRLLFFAVVWASAAAAFEIVARGQALWASRTLAGWCAWIAGAFLTAAAVQRRATDSFLGGFDLAILALVAFAALAAYGAAPGRRWLRGAGVAGFLATSIIFFTVADDLLVSGIVMTGFGIALTALIFVTNRMLKRARAAGVAS